MKQRSPIVSEFETDEQAAAYEQWLHEKVEKSLSDPRPSIAHDEALGRARAIIKAKGSRGEAC